MDPAVAGKSATVGNIVGSSIPSPVIDLDAEEKKSNSSLDCRIEPKSTAELFTHTHVGGKGGFTITLNDRNRVEEDGECNDTLVDYFAHFFLEKEMGEGLILAENVHLFSSFFLIRCMGSGNGKGDLTTTA